MDGYSGRVQTSELLQDFKTKPPVLIIDQGVARLPLLIPADPNACNQVYDPQQYETFIKTSREEAAYTYPRMPEGMDEVYYWICMNYEPVGPVGKMDWQVYRLKGK